MNINEVLGGKKLYKLQNISLNFNKNDKIKFQ